MTLVLTLEILLILFILLVVTLITLSQFIIRYRCKSQCLDDIERMTSMGSIKINDRRQGSRRIIL